MNITWANPNLVRLTAAAAKLEPLLDQIAFVGGCVTGLLLTESRCPASPAYARRGCNYRNRVLRGVHID
ncbi:MAG: hypothetical protein WBX38_22680 [Candidatus Sulfotelmatobacter sp.]